MKKLIIFFISLLILLPILAQTPIPEIRWLENIGSALPDHGSAIIHDSYGNSFITGYFRDTTDFDPSPATHSLIASGSKDGFLAKYDTSGAYLFAFSLGGTTFYDEGGELAIDDSNHIYVLGEFSSTVDFDPSPAVANLTSSAGGDIFLSKYDQFGVFMWATHWGGSTIKAHDIVVDDSGNVYAIGEFNGTIDFDGGGATYNLTCTSGKNVFIVKYNNNGNFVWAIQIETNSDCKGNDLAIDSAGNIYATGYISYLADLDPTGTVYLVNPNNLNTFIAKYSSDGNLILGTCVNSNNINVGNAIEVDDSFNIYITGYFLNQVDFDPGAGVANLTPSPSMSAECFIAKYNSVANYLWANEIGSNNWDSGNDLVVDYNNQVYIITLEGSMTRVYKFNSLGVEEWTFDIYSSGGLYLSDIEIDHFKNLYFIGDYAGNATCNSYSGNHYLSGPMPHFDVIGGKYNVCHLLGPPSVTFSLPPGEGSVCFDHAAFGVSGGDPVGGIYSGTGISSGNFDPSIAGLGTHIITYTVMDQNLCTRTAYNQVIVNPCIGFETSEVELISIYPNPADDVAIINSSIGIQSIILYDVHGNMIISLIPEFNQINSLSISLDDLKPGIYFMHLTNLLSYQTVHKLIKQ